jgi:hypothetical protein
VNIDGSPEMFNRAAQFIVQVMKTPVLRESVKVKPETMSWEQVAKLWVDAPEDVPRPLE